MKPTARVKPHQRGYAMLMWLLVLMGALTLVFTLSRADIARNVHKVERQQAEQVAEAEALARALYLNHPNYLTLDLQAIAAAVNARFDGDYIIAFYETELQSTADGVSYQSLSFRKPEVVRNDSLFDFSLDNLPVFVIDGESVQRETLARMRAQLRLLARAMEEYYITRSGLEGIELTGGRTNHFCPTADDVFCANAPQNTARLAGYVDSGLTTTAYGYPIRYQTSGTITIGEDVVNLDTHPKIAAVLTTELPWGTSEKLYISREGIQQ